MKIVKTERHTFEVVDKMVDGYEIWNIRAVEGCYLPLARPLENFKVSTEGLKAIKMKEGEAAAVLKAASWSGQTTFEKMNKYVNMYKNSKTQATKNNIKLLEKAIEVLKNYI